MYHRAKKRSLVSGVPFTLLFSDMPLIPKKCPVLGIPLFVGHVGKKGAIHGSPSLDRIRPDDGYVAGNVRVISHRANSLRKDATSDELRKVSRDAKLIDITEVNDFALS